MRDDDETLDSAAYFTQQSAEKALKAYLLFKQQAVPRTHDLERLLNDCKKYDGMFGRLQEEVELLAPFATYARYSDDRFDIDRKEADEAIAEGVGHLTESDLFFFPRFYT